MLPGLAALATVACSGGGGDEGAAPEPTSAQPAPTTAAPTTAPTAVPTATRSASDGSGPSGEPGSESDSGTGTLEVRVTDAPDSSITAVYVTTDNIEVSIAGQGWLSVIDTEITFELLVLEGVEAVLGTAELPVGKYTQVRLSVPNVQIEKDGELLTAEVPSGTIKLVGNFELAAGEKTFISLDFEVDKSLVDRQRRGFLFKPVIKLAVGEPGEEGSAVVALTGKPEPTAVPVPTRVPTPVPPTTVPVPSTSTPVPPTSTPGPTATPTATPDAVGAFFLDILEPVDGEAVVSTNTFVVVGRTSVDALVSVNDTFVDVAVDGMFTSTVNLDEGINIVEVVASTAAGDESSSVLLIIYEPAAQGN